MLPHKHDRYSLCQFSKDTVFRVGMMPYACVGEGSLIRLSEPIQYEHEGNIRCLLLETSRLDMTVTVAEWQAPVSWLVAATSTSYLI